MKNNYYRLVFSEVIFFSLKVYLYVLHETQVSKRFVNSSALDVWLLVDITGEKKRRFDPSLNLQTILNFVFKLKSLFRNFMNIWLNSTILYSERFMNKNRLLFVCILNIFLLLNISVCSFVSRSTACARINQKQ